MFHPLCEACLGFKRIKTIMLQSAGQVAKLRCRLIQTISAIDKLVRRFIHRVYADGILVKLRTLQNKIFPVIKFKIYVIEIAKLFVLALVG